MMFSRVFGVKEILIKMIIRQSVIIGMYARILLFTSSPFRRMPNDRNIAASSQANSTRSLVASLRKFCWLNIIANVMVIANIMTIRSSIRQRPCCLNLSVWRNFTFFLSSLTIRWLRPMAIPR